MSAMQGSYKNTREKEKKTRQSDRDKERVWGMRERKRVPRGSYREYKREREEDEIAREE